MQGSAAGPPSLGLPRGGQGRQAARRARTKGLIAAGLTAWPCTATPRMATYQSMLSGPQGTYCCCLAPCRVTCRGALPEPQGRARAAGLLPSAAARLDVAASQSVRQGEGLPLVVWLVLVHPRQGAQLLRTAADREAHSPRRVDRGPASQGSSAQLQHPMLHMSEEGVCTPRVRHRGVRGRPVGRLRARTSACWLLRRPGGGGALRTRWTCDTVDRPGSRKSSHSSWFGVGAPVLDQKDWSSRSMHSGSARGRQRPASQQTGACARQHGLPGPCRRWSQLERPTTSRLSSAASWSARACGLGRAVGWLATPGWSQKVKPSLRRAWPDQAAHLRTSRAGEAGPADRAPAHVRAHALRLRVHHAESGSRCEAVTVPALHSALYAETSATSGTAAAAVRLRQPDS